MKKSQQLDLFTRGEMSGSAYIKTNRAAQWEAEKKEFGIKTDQEKRKEKEKTKAFIAEEKERIFGKKKEKDDKLP